MTRSEENYSATKGLVCVYDERTLSQPHGWSMGATNSLVAKPAGNPATNQWLSTQRRSAFKIHV